MPDDILMRSKSRGFIGAHEKLKAVLDVLGGKTGTNAAARLMRVSRITIWCWKRKFIAGGLEALKPKLRGRKRRGFTGGAGAGGKLSMLRDLLEKMKRRNIALNLKNSKLKAELHLERKALDMHLAAKRSAETKTADLFSTTQKEPNFAGSEYRLARTSGNVKKKPGSFSRRYKKAQKREHSIPASEAYGTAEKIKLIREFEYLIRGAEIPGFQPGMDSAPRRDPLRGQ